MTYFKLNIKNINESISNYKKLKKSCLEDINLVYRGLRNTDSGWNDVNSRAFVEKTKTDGYELMEYFDYLDSLFNEINRFKSNIDDICYKQGYNKNSINFKFDNSELNTCKTYLNNSIYLLNECLNSVNAYEFSSDFSYKYLIYDLRTEINNIKKSINTMINDITNFNRLIENEINDSKARMKKIGNYDFDLTPIKYTYKVGELNLKG